MSTVFVYMGLPASGKTTRAMKRCEESDVYKRVNKDDIRAMLGSTKHSWELEKLVLKIRDAIIVEALEHNYSVIVDDTNLAPKHLIRIKQIAHQRATHVVTVKFPTSVEECIRRDALRAKPVGEQVIREMDAKNPNWRE